MTESDIERLKHIAEVEDDTEPESNERRGQAALLSMMEAGRLDGGYGHDDEDDGQSHRERRLDGLI